MGSIPTNRDNKSFAGRPATWRGENLRGRHDHCLARRRRSRRGFCQESRNAWFLESFGREIRQGRGDRATPALDRAASRTRHVGGSRRGRGSCRRHHCLALSTMARRFLGGTNSVSILAGASREELGNFAGGAAQLGNDAVRRIAREIKHRPLATFAVALGVGVVVVRLQDPQRRTSRRLANVTAPRPNPPALRVRILSTWPRELGARTTTGGSWFSTRSSTAAHLLLTSCLRGKYPGIDCWYCSTLTTAAQLAWGRRSRAKALNESATAGTSSEPAPYVLDNPLLFSIMTPIKLSVDSVSDNPGELTSHRCSLRGPPTVENNGSQVRSQKELMPAIEH
jgi:hypothetical protein